MGLRTLRYRDQIRNNSQQRIRTQRRRQKKRQEYVIREFVREYGKLSTYDREVSAQRHGLTGILPYSLNMHPTVTAASSNHLPLMIRRIHDYCRKTRPRKGDFAILAGSCFGGRTNRSTWWQFLKTESSTSVRGDPLKYTPGGNVFNRNLHQVVRYTGQGPNINLNIRGHHALAGLQM